MTAPLFARLRCIRCCAWESRLQEPPLARPEMPRTKHLLWGCGTSHEIDEARLGDIQHQGVVLHVFTIKRQRKPRIDLGLPDLLRYLSLSLVLTMTECAAKKDDERCKHVQNQRRSMKYDCSVPVLGGLFLRFQLLRCVSLMSQLYLAKADSCIPQMPQEDHHDVMKQQQ